MAKSTSNKHRFIVIGKLLNITVLICSLIIFLVLSIEILNGVEFISHTNYMRIQLFICIIFLIDFFYLLYISHNKTHYLLYHWLFFVISIPYLNIIQWFGIEIDAFTAIILRAILLIRGGYGLVIMITWFTKNAITNLLVSYIILLLSSVYFASLVFYTIEKNINEGISSFGDAVWWASMDVTTVGSSIEPVTTIGKILAVSLAIIGMSMFPVLTAYITNRFQKNWILKIKQGKGHDSTSEKNS